MEGDKICPEEGCRTKRIDVIRGKGEEKGVKAPASLPASSSASSAPGWPTLQTGSPPPHMYHSICSHSVMHESL